MIDTNKLPSGTVTFLFTDIEGSTPLWEGMPDDMRVSQAQHHTILREAIESNGGQVFEITGDAFAAAFPLAHQGVRAAVDAQMGLAIAAWGATGPIRVRMGLHTGPAEPNETGETAYMAGHTLNRTARIMSVGHGGQILLSQEAADLARRDLPEGVVLQDMGEHRLKGLSLPETIFQVLHPYLTAEFSALKSAGVILNNLPIQVNEFIGRKSEIESLKQRFPGTRLLTLIGPGGIGKTRLTLQTAAEILERYPDGVFFVDLALLNEPALVPGTIAEVLGVKELKTEPILETLKKFIERKSLLLIIDNMEQIIKAAPVVRALIAAGPKVDIMVTSREVLRISGEVVYTVPPLGLPPTGSQIELQQLASYESIQLFSSRARAANPDFQLTPENAADIAEICRRLDGLPLAIEIAAARSRLFTPKKLLERLSDRLKILTGSAPDRHSRQQTLRGAIDWSYDLLEPSEQKLFARLSVFSGGRSLEAVEMVCGNSLDMDVLDGLESLLDKSLIMQEEDIEGQPRIVMLETLHAYARERLEAFEDWMDILTRHAEWVLEFSESGEAGIFGQNPSLWVNRLKTEDGNIRVVLERCQSGTLAPDIGVRLAGALRYYWESTGKLREGAAWLKSMLSISTGLSNAVRAKALCGAGVLSYWLGDWQEGAVCCQQALEAGQELGDRVIVGEAQHFLAHVAQNQNDPELGLQLLTESHQNFLAIAHPWGIHRSRVCLADAQRFQQNYDLAEHNFSEAIREQRKKKGDIFMPMLLSNYGNVLNRQGKYQFARDCFLEGIRESMGLNNSLLIGYLVDGLAGTMVLSGNPEKAAILMGASAGIFEALGVTSMAAIDKFDHDYYLDAVRANLKQEHLESLWAEGKVMSVDETLRYVKNL